MGKSWHECRFFICNKKLTNVRFYICSVLFNLFWLNTIYLCSLLLLCPHFMIWLHINNVFRAIFLMQPLVGHDCATLTLRRENSFVDRGRLIYTMATLSVLSPQNAECESRPTAALQLRTGQLRALDLHDAASLLVQVRHMTVHTYYK